MIRASRVKKRLDPDGIAGEQQKVASEIQNGKGEDASELPNAGGPGFLIEMYDYFGVGA